MPPCVVTQQSLQSWDFDFNKHSSGVNPVFVTIGLNAGIVRSGIDFRHGIGVRASEVSE